MNDIKKSVCYAPLFKANNCWACLWITIIYIMVIVLLTIMLIIATLGGPEAIRKIACQIKQYAYMIKYCRRGNSDSNIVI